MFAMLRERREEALKHISDYNPFVNRTTKTSLREKVKLVAGGCTVLPLRCLGLGPLLLGLYGLTSLSIIGLSDEKLKEKPLTSWRKGVLYPTVKYGSRVLLFLLGYQWVKTKGEASAEAPIVISNHPSWFEHLWLLHVYVPSVVGKEDVKKVPLYGTYAKAIQTIFVKRSSPESRKEAAEEIYERVSTRYERLKQRSKKDADADDLQRQRYEERASTKRAKKAAKQQQRKQKSKASPQDDNGLMGDEEEEQEQHVDTSPDGTPREEENGGGHDGGKKKKKEKGKKRRKASRTDKGVWPPLFLFAEGGNSSAQGFISFKLGAFNPGVPIQPVAVTLPYKHHDVSPAPGTKKFSLLVRTLCQFHNKMNVTYLPVYYPSEEEQADPKLYAHNVRQAMADELATSGIQATEHSYEDVILLHHALRRRYPHDKVLLETRKLLDHFEILELNKNTLTRCLDKFIAMDTDRSGEVTFQEFCSVLHLPDADITSRLFAFLDIDSDGRINFREYITGMATLWKVLKPRALTDVFALFAGEGGDHFTLSHARESLRGLFACLTDEQIDGILSKVGDLKTPDTITFDEFEAWAKDNPEYIHLLLTTDQMAAAARRRGSAAATAGLAGEEEKGKGKQKADVADDDDNDDDGVNNDDYGLREIKIESGSSSSDLSSDDEVDRTNGERTTSTPSSSRSGSGSEEEEELQTLQKAPKKSDKKVKKAKKAKKPDEKQKAKKTKAKKGKNKQRIASDTELATNGTS